MVWQFKNNAVGSVEHHRILELEGTLEFSWYARINHKNTFTWVSVTFLKLGILGVILPSQRSFSDSLSLGRGLGISIFNMHHVQFLSSCLRKC